MKYLVFILGLLIAHFAHAQEEDKSVQTRLKLKGNVKSVTYLYYDAFEKFGKMQIKYKGKDVYNFNNNRDLISVCNYDLNNKQGVKANYVYDKSNKLVEINVFLGSQFLSKIMKKYKEDLLIEDDRYYKNGDILSKTLYKYDSLELLIFEEKFNSNGKAETRTEYQHEYYNDGTKKVYKNTIFVDQYTSENDISVYDSIGNIINLKSFKNGSDMTEIKYTYNGNGDLITIRNGDDTPTFDDKITYGYKYDFMNNVTEKIKYEKKFDRPTPVEYTKVEIIYMK